MSRRVHSHLDDETTAALPPANKSTIHVGLYRAEPDSMSTVGMLRSTQRVEIGPQWELSVYLLRIVRYRLTAPTDPPQLMKV